MKEKINKFFAKGWHLLAGIWLNVAFMGYAIIDGLVEGSWQHALIGFIIYLPWLLLFFNEYRNHKTQMKTVFLIKLMDGVNDNLIAIIERYKKLYGELPPEEENQKPEESEK